MEYTNHIASVVKNVSYKMMLLGKLHKYLNNEGALIIYKSMLLPYSIMLTSYFIKQKRKKLGDFKHCKIRGDVKIPHSRMTKTHWETLVKCMRQVTKGHLYHVFGVSDYYVMYKHRAQSVL